MKQVLLLGLILLAGSCKGDKGESQPIVVDTTGVSDVAFYMTKSDKSALFKKQTAVLQFKDTFNVYPTLTVNENEQFQSMEGFGYCLTGGSATLIHSLPESQQDALLKELFGTDSAGIGVSYLRITIGASDLSASTFTYDDMPDGQTDETLAHFSIAKEQAELIPVLKKILAIAPGIKILGSPWSAPTWMKTNNAFIGGNLKKAYYSVYANYFVKYIQAMKAEGITIDAITPQNEPLHGGNNPSMVMEAANQLVFVRDHLGPAFKAAGIATKIIIYDHNADRVDYPATVLKDADAKQYIDGSAFHLYGGNIAALTELHNAYPDKNVYFTEQWVGAPGDFASNLQWHITNLIIGAPRNWSRNVIEWNLAADAGYNPHTPGGCDACVGALTINGGTVTKNVGYYIIAHASKFVRPGAVRIATDIKNQLDNVAFKTTAGQRVLIVMNNGNAPQTFNIQYNGKIVTTALPNGAVGTYVW